MSQLIKYNRTLLLSEALRDYINYSKISDFFQVFLGERLRDSLGYFLAYNDSEEAETICMYIESKRYAEALEALNGLMHTQELNQLEA